jgi:hypothetical protein
MTITIYMTVKGEWGVGAEWGGEVGLDHAVAVMVKG